MEQMFTNCSLTAFSGLYPPLPPLIESSLFFFNTTRFFSTSSFLFLGEFVGNIAVVGIFVGGCEALVAFGVGSDVVVTSCIVGDDDAGLAVIGRETGCATGIISSFDVKGIDFDSAAADNVLESS
eukprot:CAMPEP_0171302256 /NCGR_PEP_ID=MMETSP0816-20121228/11603_1 /TAXON_ID=420281 /ORGANISM="Proboscia inermis, Strain CCAP1064/1" /LENGTH=124 /DNA_ID=CAMNT_0011780539 /DNA_START=483 /DNA_END=857 /DNA_ORIENTATION=-